MLAMMSWVEAGAGEAGAGDGAGRIFCWISQPFLCFLEKICSLCINCLVQFDWVNK